MESFEQEHIQFDGKKLRVLDQRKLPYEQIWLESDDDKDLNDWITDMVVRGAPLIGIVGAYSGAFAYQKIMQKSVNSGEIKVELKKCLADTFSTRPTAVNLKWALDQIWDLVEKANELPACEELFSLSLKIWKEDVEGNKNIAKYAFNVLEGLKGVLTHCNTGSLATGGFGTALGVIRFLNEKSSDVKAYATETRPYQQGGRLTVFELSNWGLNTTLLCDSAAAQLMSQGKIEAVITGADRIAKNGDVANKIGTLSLAILARYYNIPFYVAAPLSSFDFATESGKEIPIEQRSALEVTHVSGKGINFDGCKVFNPAFDVTQSDLVTAYFHEKGVWQTPFPAEEIN